MKPLLTTAGGIQVNTDSFHEPGSLCHGCRRR